jgi:hypothetical protein
MIKFRYQLILLAVMAALMPFRSELSSCCLTYMFGHAGWLHFMLNALSHALLWRMVSPQRLVVAWVCAAACWFLPSSIPVLGWSVVIYFLVGLTLARRCGSSRLNVVLSLVVSFFIPGIAALHHALMLGLGFLWSKWEGVWSRTL